MAKPELLTLARQALASELVALAVFRYDKSVLAAVLGRMSRMILSVDLLKENWLYQDGFSEGEARGAINAKRDAVVALLRSRFPLVSPTPIETITDPAVLDTLLLTVANARNEADAQAALRGLGAA